MLSDEYHDKRKVIRINFTLSFITLVFSINFLFCFLTSIMLILSSIFLAFFLLFHLLESLTKKLSTQQSVKQVSINFSTNQVTVKALHFQHSYMYLSTFYTLEWFDISAIHVVVTRKRKSYLMNELVIVSS